MTLIHTITNTTTQVYVDTAVQAGHSYWYEVKAYDAGGESAPSNIAPATIPAPPPPVPPGNLVAQVN